MKFLTSTPFLIDLKNKQTSRSMAGEKKSFSRVSNCVNCRSLLSKISWNQRNASSTKCYFHQYFSRESKISEFLHCGVGLKCNRSLSHTNFLFFSSYFFLFAEWKISSNPQQNARVQNRGTRLRRCG